MSKNVNKNVEELSNEIAERSINEANYFPVDRLFLQPYMEKIISFNYLEFILFNIEKTNPTYTNQLFLCLPELWEKVVYDDFDVLLENFTNSFSYYILIEFSYKYLEIDILELVVNKSIVKGFYFEVKQYLLLQSHVMIQTDEERDSLEFNEGKEFLGYDPAKWGYIKQRLLADPRIVEAKQNYKELKARIAELIHVD